MNFLQRKSFRKQEGEGPTPVVIRLHGQSSTGRDGVVDAADLSDEVNGEGSDAVVTQRNRSCVSIHDRLE